MSDEKIILKFKRKKESWDHRAIKDKLKHWQGKNKERNRTNKNTGFKKVTRDPREKKRLSKKTKLKIRKFMKKLMHQRKDAESKEHWLKTRKQQKLSPLDNTKRNVQVRQCTSKMFSQQWIFLRT